MIPFTKDFFKKQAFIVSNSKQLHEVRKLLETFGFVKGISTDCEYDPEYPVIGVYHGSICIGAKKEWEKDNYRILTYNDLINPYILRRKLLWE